MLTQSDLFLAAAGFLSGLIKTGVGVGSGLVLLPTLALVFPAKVALGLGAPMLLASDIIGLHYYWKQWLPRRELTRLFLAIIPGLFIGIVLLPMIPGRAFRIGVGIFGALYALGMLWPQFPVTALGSSMPIAGTVKSKTARARISMDSLAGFPPYWHMPAVWSGRCTSLQPRVTAASSWALRSSFFLSPTSIRPSHTSGSTSSASVRWRR